MRRFSAATCPPTEVQPEESLRGLTTPWLRLGDTPIEQQRHFRFRWIVAGSVAGVLVLSGVIWILTRPPSISGTSWTGSEHLAGFDRLRFDFHRSTNMV